MFYLRAVGNHSVFAASPFVAERATTALLDQRGGLTSVFKVADHPEAERIVVLFAMGGRDRPDRVDYVLIPEQWLADLNVVPVPDRVRCFAHSVLRNAHHELHGLDAPGIVQQLAEKFRGSTDLLGAKLNVSQVVQLAKREVGRVDTGTEALKMIEGKAGWHHRMAKLPT